DPVKKDKFYRAMGGGVEFGETSKQALQREFQEEIQAEITNIRYLACLENIFTFQGKPGHEIIQLYQCDFVHPKFYQQQTIPFNEGERQKTALWVDIETLKSGSVRLVPEGFVEYLG
ncbi:MAG: NUDIX hydrolase, partial [Rivularia sp. (in: cyanobacteria)]